MRQDHRVDFGTNEPNTDSYSAPVGFSRVISSISISRKELVRPELRCLWSIVIIVIHCLVIEAAPPSALVSSLEHV